MLMNAAEACSPGTIRHLTSAQVDVWLRALHTVVAARVGREEPQGCALMQSAAAVLGARVAADELGTATPDEVMRAFTSAELRLRVLQAMEVIALLDGEASGEEAKVLDRFRAALCVDDGCVGAVSHLASRYIGAVRLDMSRRIPLHGGPDLRTAGEDVAVAGRYRRLEALRVGTLGRTFWEHMTSRGFALPGECGGLPERAVHHDMMHVVTGYDTGPRGETQIAGFYAGMFHGDPFVLVLGTLLMFQLGIQLSTIADPLPLEWDPDLVLRAFARGARCNAKLTDDWDFWRVIDRPLGELRYDLGLCA